MTRLFCWWCGQPLALSNHAKEPKKYFVALQDGHAARVHKACITSAAEYVRLSRMSAQDPGYARMPQHEQLNRAVLDRPDGRRRDQFGRKRKPSAEDN